MASLLVVVDVDSSRKGKKLLAMVIFVADVTDVRCVSVCVHTGCEIIMEYDVVYEKQKLHNIVLLLTWRDPWI
jgi:hypothetical protein